MSLWDMREGLCVLHHLIHTQLVSDACVHSTLHEQQPVSFVATTHSSFVHKNFLCADWWLLVARLTLRVELFVSGRYGWLARMTSKVVLLRHIVEACNEAGSMEEGLSGRLVEQVKENAPNRSVPIWW